MHNNINCSKLFKPNIESLKGNPTDQFHMSINLRLFRVVQYNQPMTFFFCPGMLQMLMDTELDITQQDYVRTAQASGKTLVSLINEVLDQAKIESGKLELEAVQFELRAILDDVLSLFYGKSQEKGIEVNE